MLGSSLKQGSLSIDIKGYPKQIEFLQNKELLSGFFGGWGCGKTHIGAEKGLMFVLKNLGGNGLITAPSYRLLRVTFDKYMELFPSSIIKRHRSQPPPEIELVKAFNSAKLYFWSTDKPETIQAIEVAWCHMDEAGLSPYLSFRNARARLRQRKPDGTEYPYQLWATTTPRQLHWLYKEFIEQPHFFVTASTRENIYIDAEAYIGRIGLSGPEAEQNIEGKFVILGGDCLFELKALETQLVNCCEPEDVDHNGLVLIWKKPVFGAHYIAGADCADEGGEGVNDCIVMDAQTGEEVAEIYGDIAADYFASLIFDVCSHYNNALVAVERNHTAGGIVTKGLQDVDYKNLFTDNKGKIGWNTDSFNRFPMLTEYKLAVENRQTVIRNSDAIGEMSTFVRDERGKFRHLQEQRDDRVMARAICWQMRENGQVGEAGCVSFEYKVSI